MEISTVFAEQSDIKHTLVLQRLIGQGKFHVYHAKAASLPESDFAVKVFPKSSVSSFTKETEVLSKLNHPKIIKYFPIREHNLQFDMFVTEYTPNGDFLDLVSKGAIKNEKLMRTYFHQFIEGLEYLHSLGIGHLDLKLENLILDKDFSLRIIDFDQAQSVQDNQLFSAGTEGYRAPELLNGQFEGVQMLDMYAVGVILFALFTGQLPFAEKKVEGMKPSASYDLFRDDKERFWREKGVDIGKTFSKELKDLLNGLLEENPEKRFKIEDLKRSRWYNMGEVYTEGELGAEVTKIVEVHGL